MLPAAQLTRLPSGCRHAYYSLYASDSFAPLANITLGFLPLVRTASADSPAGIKLTVFMQRSLIHAALRVAEPHDGPILADANPGIGRNNLLHQAQVLCMVSSTIFLHVTSRGMHVCDEDLH